MATQEITISELELADEILGDMNIPVDTATETRAVTLKQLRAWLGSALPVGSIFASIGRLDDERFTLLDGKTISRTGTYQAFCNKVVEKVQAGTWKACTEEEFNLELSETGQCGKFVVSNDYVRIPKLGNSLYSGVIDGKIPVVGNGKALGLTDGTNTATIKYYSNNYCIAPFTAATAGSNVGATASGVSSSLVDDKLIGVTTDATKSGIEGKLETTPVEVFYYMVVSTEGQAANVEIDINKIYEDMNLKANTSLSNLTADGKSLASGLGMPSNKYTSLTLGSSGTNYTAPANGWFFLEKLSGASAYVQMRNKTNEMKSYARTTVNSDYLGAFVPVRKGDVVNISYSLTGETKVFRFIYAEGGK